MDERFAVVVHDVAPVYLPHLESLAAALASRVGRQVSGAVVPCWHGSPIGEAAGEFAQFVADAFGEVLQHGYTHRQERPGLLSLFTGRSDELAGVPRDVARRRLVLGREMLSKALGTAPAGFVAPAWQLGRLSVNDLAECGFRYLASFGAIRSTSGSMIPLSTWSWDWGVFGELGRVGQWLGDVSWQFRPERLPCVVVHPADVVRGYLPDILDVVDRLMRRGRTPSLLSEFLK